MAMRTTVSVELLIPAGHAVWRTEVVVEDVRAALVGIFASMNGRSADARPGLRQAGRGWGRGRSSAGPRGIDDGPQER